MPDIILDDTAMTEDQIDIFLNLSIYVEIPGSTLDVFGTYPMDTVVDDSAVIAAVQW